MSKFYWMAVTTDEFEFPLVVEESAVDLASSLGITVKSIYTSVGMGRSGKINGQRFVKVRKL